MSGTSLDGVDIALIETDGERIAALGPTGYRPYSDAERNLLRQALAKGVSLSNRSQRPGVLKEAEAFITRALSFSLEDFL
jgi:anhydro-N-acetylmuramic acid kinase